MRTVRYDMIFDAEAKVTDSGWQMEMRIPFGVEISGRSRGRISI